MSDRSMATPFEPTSYTWLLLISAFLLFALAAYGWRHRNVVGARTFVLACLLAGLWTIAAAFESAASLQASQVFWGRLKFVLTLGPVIAIFCFALEYAGFGHWLTPRRIGWLAAPSLVLAAAALTNGWHQWLWPGETAAVVPQTTLFYPLLTLYGYALSIGTVLIFIRLLIRSPFHRWPVALILVGALSIRLVYLVDLFDLWPGLQVDLMPVAAVFASTMYGIGLFRGRMFNPVSLAYETAIEQMQDAILVVDPGGRILSANPAAAALLELPPGTIAGQLLAERLPQLAAVGRCRPEIAPAPTELILGTPPTQREYSLSITPLQDRRGLELGCLLLFHDITADKHNQNQILEQQRVLATLQERERLARELHDSTGQVLGYVSMQANAIIKRLEDGEVDLATAQLTRLAGAAQAAHIDIRDSILNLRSGGGESWSFLPALHQYIKAYHETYAIDTKVQIDETIQAENFAPEDGVQVMRVIQEALTNARKHSQTHRVSIVMRRENGVARITIADDGRGFETSQTTNGTTDHYGLRFMRERMEKIGGRLAIDSKPGAGTMVLLEVPIRPKEEADE